MEPLIPFRNPFAMRHYSLLIFSFLLFAGLCHQAQAQTMRLKLEIRGLWFNDGDDPFSNKPDPTWKVRAQIPLLAIDSEKCVHISNTSQGFKDRSSNPDLVFDYNQTPPVWLLNFPTNILVSLDAWENDRGSDCSYDCCGAFTNDDDARSQGSIAIPIFPLLQFPGNNSFIDFSVTGSNGHYRADLRLSLLTLDVYDGAMAITDLNGNNMPLLCEGDTYRIDANVHFPPYTSYTMLWERQNGSGGWDTYTITTNSDFIDVTATSPITHYRARMVNSMDEQDGYRSTEALNVTVSPAPPNPNNISVSTPTYCVGQTGIIRVNSIGGVNQSTDFFLILSGDNLPSALSATRMPSELPYEFTGLTDGSYDLLVIEAGANSNCAADINGINIAAKPLPTITNFSVNNPNCNGGTGSVFVQMSNPVGNNSYELRQGGLVVASRFTSSSQAYITGVQPGTYDLLVRNGNACESSVQSVTITEPPAISATAVIDPGQGGFNIACNGDRVDVVVTITGGTGSLFDVYGTDFGIFNRPSPVTVSVPANGGTSTTYSVRDELGCVRQFTLGSITEPSTPIVLTVNGTTGTGACNAVGTVDFSATGGAGSYTYYVDNDTDNTNSTGMFSGLGGGNHLAYVEDAAGCIRTESFSIAQSPSLSFTETSNIEPSCFGFSNGSFMVQASGGVPPYFYSLDGGDTFSGATAAGVDVGLTNIPAGDYEVIVMDSDPTGACEYSEFFTVGEPDEILITDVQVAPIVCSGDAADIIIHLTSFEAAVPFIFGGGGEISLNGGSSWQSFAGVALDEAAIIGVEDILTGSATPYQIMIRRMSDDGLALCESTNSFEVILEEPAPFSFVSTPSSTEETCFGDNDGTITAAVTGGREPYVFTLYNDAGVVVGSDTVGAVGGVATVTFDNLVPESAVTGDVTTGYAVAVRDGSALIGAVNNLIDEGTFANESPMNCALVYPPSFDTTGLTLSNASETMIGITPATQLTMGTITDTSADPLNCFGDFGTGNNGEVTVTAVTGGTGPYEYALDNFNYQSSNVITGMGQGDTVWVRDTKGCVIFEEYNGFTQRPAITTTLSLVEAATTCTQGTIQVDLADGVGPYLIEVFDTALGSGPACEGPFLFFGGSDPVKTVNSATSSITIDELQTGTYDLAIYDEATGCSYCSNGSITVPLLDPLDATTTNRTDESCDPGSDGTITFSITGGTPPYSTEINFASPQAGATPTFSGLSAFTPYAFRVTDAVGCQIIFADSIDLVTELDLMATPTDITSCAGDENGALTVEPVNGTAPYTVIWNFDQTTVTLNAGETTTKTDLPAGEYEFSISDANGCTAELAAYIQEPDSIQSQSIDIVDAACDGVGDGSLTITVVGGTGTLMYALDGGTPQTSNSFSGLLPGDYTITVSDASGCSFDFFATVGANSSISASTSVTDASCTGFSDGQIEVFPSGGTAPYDYSLDGAPFSTDNPITGLAAGTYEVTVRDNNGCTFVISGIVVGEASPLVVNVNVIQDATCLDPTGTLEAVVSGGTGPYSFEWDGNPTLNNATLTNASAGDHTVVVTDANGCTGSQTGTISDIPSVGIQLDSSSDENCDQGNGTITVSEVGGTAPFSFSLDGGTPQATGDFTGLAAGTYLAEVVDGNGCTASISVTIANTPPPTLAVIDTQNSLCVEGNGSITVEATGGTPPYQYSIDGGSLQASPAFNDLNAGTYTLLVQDANGCENTTSATIDLETPPVVDLIVTDAACGQDDGEILAGVTGGAPPYSYAWSHSGETTNQVADLAPGDYTVTVTDDNGCTTEATATVAELSGPDVVLEGTTDATCGDANGSATISVSGGSPPYVIVWSVANPSVTTVNNLPEGSHSVAVEDARGCITPVVFTIGNIPGPSSLDLDVTDSFCGEGNGAITVTVIDGTAPYNYAWSHDASEDGPTVSGLASGSYTVTVTDANGCTISASETVDFVAGPTIDPPVVTNSLCDNGNGSISITAVGGTPPYTYTWDNGIGLAGATITDLSVGTYTVTVTDANLCEATATASIALEPAPILFVEQAIDENCDQANGLIEVLVVGGTGTAPFTYNWSHDASLDEPIASGLSAGTYTVTITDDNNCEGEATITLENIPGPTLEQGTVTPDICGMSVGEITVNTLGGQAPFTFNWDGFPGETGATLSNIGSGTYDVTVTDANNCTASLSVVVGEIDGPSISLANTTDDPCTDNDAVATVETTSGTIPYSYSWSHDAGLNSPVATGLSTGTYTVMVTDGNGCTAETTFDVTDVGPPSLTLGPVTDSQCGFNDGSIEVIPTGGTEPYSFVWSDGNLPNSAIVVGLTADDYSVTLTDANGCTAIVSASVAEFGGPILSVAEVIDAACNDNEGSITIDVTEGISPYTYSWSHNAGLNSPTASGLAAAEYIVTVTDNAGCERTISATVATLEELTLSVESFEESNCVDGVGSLTVAGSGGLPPYTIDWDHDLSETSFSLDNLLAATYTATITDANGCTASVSQAIQVIEGPTVSVFQQVDPDCGQTNGLIDTDIFGGTPPYDIDWSHNGTSNPFQGNLGAGDYTITVIDDLGCETSLTVTLSEPETIQLEISDQQDEFCGMANGSISVAVTNGPGDFTYAWSHDAGLDSPTASGLTAGTYTITVTGVDFCESTISTTIGEVDGPSLSAPVVTDSDCNASNGSVSFTVSGGTAPLTYSWEHDMNLMGPDATGLSAGFYSLTVTDANGCTAIGNATVSDDEAPVPSIASSNDPSCLNNDGSITVSVTGGVMPYTYSWSHDTDLDSPMAENLPAGDYSLTVTDANGCLGVVSQTLTVNDPPALTIVSQSNSICTDDNGSIEVAGSGGTPPYSYAWSHDANASGASQTGLAAGTYDITLSDDAGCIEIISVTLEFEEGPSLTLSDNTNAICTDNGSLTVTADGGAAPLSYVWSHNDQLNSNTANGLAIGTYAVTVTDANGCTATLSADVAGSVPPVLSATATNPVCTEDSGSIEITATGGTAPYSYSWSHDMGLNSNLATGLVAGMYSVTVTDANGCTATIEQELTFAGGPSVAVTSQSDSFCTDDNGSITVEATGGEAPYSYEWSHDAGLDNPAASGLSGGSYSVTVTDANGCTASTSTTISFVAGPSLSWTEVADSSCDTDDGSLTVEATGGTEPYSYAWSHDNSLNNATASGLAPGSYTVTVTDANGCTAELSNSISAADLMVEFTAISQPSCNGVADGSITAAATGGAEPYTYVWNTGQTGPTISDLAAGTYIVTVTDAGGCQAIAEAELTTGDGLALSFNVTPPLCNGEASGVAEVIVDGGSGNYTYAWDAPGNPNTPVASNLPAGTYSVTVTDDLGCSNSAMVTVPETPGLELSTTSTASCLNLLNGTATVEVDGGTGPYSYLWDDPSTQMTATATDLEPGQYNVTVTDSNGCSSSTSAIVNAAPAVTAEISEVIQPDCDVNPTGSATVLVTGGSGNYTYQWDDPDSQTTATATGLVPGTYSVTITDANACFTTLMVTIEAPGDLLITVSSTQAPDCVGDANGSASVQVSNGSGNYSYSWNDPDGQSTATLSSVTAGTYSVTVTDLDNGCFAIQEVVVPAATELTLSLDMANSPSCGNTNDGNALVVAGGGAGDYQYAWDDPAMQMTAFADNLEAGDYNVTVTDANGCTQTLQVNIPEGQAISASIDVFSAPSCFGVADGSATVDVEGASGNQTYLWDDPAFQQTQQATGLTPGTYTVTITDVGGCETTASVEIPETPELLVNLSASVSPSCSGFDDGSLTIAISGGTGATTILWDDLNAQSTATATGLTGGDYTVTVTDENGCQVIETYTLEDAVALSLNTTQEDPSCFNTADGSLTAALSGGTNPYSYAWDDPDSQTGATASNLIAGMYTVTATDANGCSVVQAVELTTTAEEITLDETVGDPSCEGGLDGTISVQAAGGAGGLTYAWSTGANESSLTGVNAGTYGLTVTDNEGCAVEASYELVEGAPFVIDLGPADTSVCAGELLIYDFSDEGYQLSWSSDQGFSSSDDIVLLEDAATYSVTATNEAGCTSENSVTLSLGSDAFQALFIVPTDVVVDADVAAVEVSWPKPDEVEWFYDASNVDLVSSNQNQYIFNFPTVGEFDLTMRAVAGGCEDWITKTVIVHADSSSIPSPFQGQPELLGFTLDPNPNGGVFDVQVELSEVKPVVLSIFSATGVEQDRRILNGQTIYDESYALNVAPGVYICILQTPTQRKSILFTVVSP